MQENRAFDEYYGTMRGVRGFNDRSSPLLPTGRNPFYQPISIEKESYYNKYLLPYHLSFNETSATCMPAPTMTYPCDISMWHNGRMDAWNTARDAGYGMSYFNRTDLPFYYTLGDNFLINDNYYQSTFTATNPNRLHLFSGSNGLSVQFIGNNSINPNKYVLMDDSEPSEGINWETMAETLEDAGITWKVYQQHDNFDDNAFAWFDQFKKAQPGTKLYDLGMARVPDLVEAFAQDVSNDSLPQVSWIVGPANLSEHAEYHPQDGEDLSARLIKVLGDPNNVNVYKKTIFILNYDEGGQFYDHLWVPTAPMNPKNGISDGKSTVTTDGEVLLVENDAVTPNHPIGPGFRVPMFIISPWTHHPGGIVYSELTDHTSVLRLVEEKFGVKCPNISPWRRAVMSNLLYAFDFDNPNYTFPILPDTSQNINASHYQCENNPNPVVPSFDQQFMPSQESGTKLSRKLPYKFDIIDNIISNTNQQLNITMINNGNTGVVFHIFNYINMSNAPMKYTIEKNKSLYDLFDINSDGKYNYSLHGPNGFVRQFAGSDSQNMNINININVRMEEIGDKDSIGFEFEVKGDDSDGNSLFIFEIEDLGYGRGKFELKYERQDMGTKRVEKSVSDSGNWYDYLVKLVSVVDNNGDNNDNIIKFSRRYMGRVENGKDLITDPFMGKEIIDINKGKHPSPNEYFQQWKPKYKENKQMCMKPNFRSILSKDFCWNKRV